MERISLIGLLLLTVLPSLAEENWPSELMSKKWVLTCEMTADNSLQGWGAEGPLPMFFGRNHSLSVSFRLDKTYGWVISAPSISLFSDVSGLVSRSGKPATISQTVALKTNFLDQNVIKIYLGGANVTLARVASGGSTRFIGPLVRFATIRDYPLGACILE